jgi:hypothetical protein
MLLALVKITLLVYFFLPDLVPLLQVLAEDHIGIMLTKIDSHEIMEILRRGMEDGLEFGFVQ